MGQLPKIPDTDWAGARSVVRRGFQKIESTLFGKSAEVTHAEMTLTGLTASRLVATDSSKMLASVSDLASWITGTANEINIANDGDGTITIGIVDPLIVGKGGTGIATLTNHGILLGSGTGAITPLAAAADGQLPIGSTGADPVLATLTGTANQVAIANAAGSITLSTPQDIHTGASPTFGDLIISTPVNIYALSHDSFADFAANEHINHTGVTLTAGTGLTGGGDISANRTFAVDGVLEDLDTLGAAASDGQMIVGTGAGAFAYESGATLRTSIGLGTSDSVVFSSMVLGHTDLNTSVLRINNSSDACRFILDVEGLAGEGRQSWGIQTDKTVNGDFTIEKGTVGECPDTIVLYSDSSGNISIGKSSPVSIFDVGIGELTCGSINRTTGTLTLEVGGIAQVSITNANTLLAGTFESTGIATLADASITKTTAAPTTDAMIANKKYVDDTSSGVVTSHESTYNHSNYNTAYSHSQAASGNPHSVTPTELGLVIGTNVQAYDAALTSISGLTYASPSFIKMSAENTYVVRTIAETKSDLSLNLVENTALSTWAGSANITILGTIASITGFRHPSSHTIININSSGADKVSQIRFSNNDVLKWDISSRGTIDATNDRLAFLNQDGLTEPLSLLQNGYVGFGEASPVTHVEMKSANPYFTLHNPTVEDSDGGRESRIIARGHQSGNEETILGYDEWSHDGAADDEKGMKRWYLNDGNDGTTPTLRMKLDSAGVLTVGSGTSTQWDTAYSHSQLTTGNPHSVSASDISLGNVENTALSTWAGTTNITTLGTISTVGNITIADGGVIRCAGAPVIVFNDTDNYLGITGCSVGIGTNSPTGKVNTLTASEETALTLQSSGSAAGTTTIMKLGEYSGRTDGLGAALFTNTYINPSITWSNKLQIQTMQSTGVWNIGILLDSTGNVGINDLAPAEKLDVDGNINCTGVYKVDDVQVVGNQGAAVADATDATTTMARLNDLLAICRTHGLIAAA